MRPAKRILIILLIAALCATGIPAMTTRAAADGAKLVAFTFDDGPNQYTSQLLDGLEARGVVATFFMNGSNGAGGVSNYASLLPRMYNDGCQLANHTWDHTYLASLSSSAIVSEVTRVETYLYNAVGGTYRDFVRTPGGQLNSTIRSSVGAPIILWSVDTNDWRYRDESTVYSNIVNGVSDGSIVLMHDLYITTVRAALRAIDTLKAQGYEFVTVAELMRRRGITPQNGSVYYSAPNEGINLPAYSAPNVTMTISGDDIRVAASSSADGVTIYYTTDGSTPTLASNRYTGPVAVKGSGTLTFCGIDAYATRTPAYSVYLMVTRSGSVFIDVPASAWYREAVDETVTDGVMQGVGSARFSPSGTLTRAMLTQLIYNMEGQPAVTGGSAFSDVSPSEWYYDAIEWAEKSGIVNGYGDGRFGPNEPVTREQLVTIFYRYAGTFLGYDTSARSDLNGYTDTGRISAYAVDAMRWAVGTGLITGMGDGTLAPAGRASRAQVAQIYVNYRDNVLGSLSLWDGMLDVTADELSADDGETAREPDDDAVLEAGIEPDAEPTEEPDAATPAPVSHEPQENAAPEEAAPDEDAVIFDVFTEAEGE